MHKHIRVTALLATMVMLIGVLMGCSDQQTNGASIEQNKIILGYALWDSEIASTHVVKEVLEGKLGYEVELKTLDPAMLWQGVAQGDLDATVSAWLPYTHADYYQRLQHDVDYLGANLEGAKLGLVVPAYVDINTIGELNSIKDQLDGKIIGIDAGASYMTLTEEAIDEYQLDLELVSSSAAAMIAELSSAIKEERYIVVTGWTPHWKFLKYDLKYLEDPKEILGTEEHIATLARKGLKEDNPEVYNFLDKFYWEPSDMESVMLKIQEGMSPEQAAKEWVESNSDKVAEWIN